MLLGVILNSLCFLGAGFWDKCALGAQPVADVGALVACWAVCYIGAGLFS